MFALDPILVIVWVLMKPVSLKKKTNKKNRQVKGRLCEDYFIK